MTTMPTLTFVSRYARPVSAQISHGPPSSA